MSRVASKPVTIPKGVEINFDGGEISVKGSGGQLSLAYNTAVEVSQEGSELKFLAKDGSRAGLSHAGTVRSLVNNMVTGVSTGFEKRLQLVGVGYRAAVQGQKINLTLGFSHPVEYELPKGLTAEAASQTEIVLRGADKHLLGQVAAEIRAFRPPEPYKGKGVRYSDENVVRKEAKKK